MDDVWQVQALKYAEMTNRVRRENFMFDDDHATAAPIDFYVWLLRGEGRAILVDTGFDAPEAARRGRAVLRDPVEALAAAGVAPEAIDTVIVTHLHFDHAGGLDRYPNATFHLQASEMAYATGPCMCHGALQAPFTVDHVVEMVRHVYSGRVVFHDGDGPVAPGVTVHRIGGHSKGLQAVRVKTRTGHMCLASDASHFYENYLTGKLFPIVVDVDDMLAGFSRIQQLASAPALCIPGHDPLVGRIFPADGAPFIHRLDVPISGFDPLSMGPPA